MEEKGRSAPSRYLRDRKGISALEYAILVIGAIVAVGVGVGIFSTEIQNAFNVLGDRFTDVAGTIT